MTPFNQIYQLNHLLIWIVKLSHLLPTFCNDDDIINEVIKGENEKSEDNQDNEESTPPTWRQLMKLKTRR